MSSGSLLLVILAVSVATVREASAQSLRNDSCGACNCQFNNIDIFNSIMDTKIDARLNRAESRINSTLNSLNSSLSSVTSALAGQPGKWS